MKTASITWDLVGHRWAIRFLRQAVDTETVSHAYLFTGPANVGKTTLALALASALLCQNSANAQSPCGACRSCRLVASGNHPDLHLVESERIGVRLKIEQIRDLEHQLALTPVEGRWRVAILSRFEEATISAANALLKTLEEPPPYVVIAVLANDTSLLLPTIVSRCQQVPLRPVPVSTVREALIERWNVEAEQADLLAHLSGGRVGWAVRQLEDETALQRRARRLDDLDHLLTATITERFRYAETLARTPIAVQETLDLWIGWWRDVMLLAADADRLLTHVDRRRMLREHARRFGVRRSLDVLKALQLAVDRLSRNANPRVVLEVLMLDLPK